MFQEACIRDATVDIHVLEHEFTVDVCDCK